MAGAAMLVSMSGTPYAMAVIVIAAIFTSYALVDSPYSTIRTEVLQLLIICPDLRRFHNVPRSTYASRKLLFCAGKPDL
jgi:hypothetical protein